jgi:hypothetical protein
VSDRVAANLQEQRGFAFATCRTNELDRTSLQSERESFQPGGHFTHSLAARDEG